MSMTDEEIAAHVANGIRFRQDAPPDVPTKAGAQYIMYVEEHAVADGTDEGFHLFTFKQTFDYPDVELMIWECSGGNLYCSRVGERGAPEHIGTDLDYMPIDPNELFLAYTADAIYADLIRRGVDHAFFANDETAWHRHMAAIADDTVKQHEWRKANRAANGDLK